ncbi:MAG TPA: chemotaxis protein CheW [Nitrospiria bacterium]|jgi:purine-binding chemotaxis protein CheW|nr:chemotaxis protein CheW [Nitrospiria bacterium]
MASMPQADSKDKTIELRVVTFQIDDREYAVDISKIIEIIYYRPATPLPQTPGFIEGVVDLRGTVIPVLDLKKRLRLPSKDTVRRNHILIVRFKNKMIGIVVDEVKQVVKIDERQIQSSQNIMDGGGSKYLQGVCKINDRLVFLLSLDSLMTDDEHAQLNEI